MMNNLKIAVGIYIVSVQKSRIDNSVHIRVNGFGK